MQMTRLVVWIFGRKSMLFCVPSVMKSSCPQHTMTQVPSYQSLRIAGLDWLILLLSLDAIGWSTGSLIPSFYSWLLFISDDGR